VAAVAADDDVSVNIEVELGPTLRTAIDVLELAREVAELIPDWHAAEREELVARAQALIDIIERQLGPKPKP
jgi:hypothetical protein